MVDPRLAPPTIAHPLLTSSSSHAIKLYSAESHVFVLLDGAAQHLFEVDHGDLRKDDRPPPTLRLLEGFEGVGVTLFIRGSRNRFGVITEAGDFWIH